MSIILVIIDLLVILSFLYLEGHYRYYLLKIAEAATEYERELDLGVKLKECDQYRNNPLCDRSSISKCLKCMHDNGMEQHIKTAHFIIYALLLAIGFAALNGLLFIKIKLPFMEFITSLLIILLIAIGSPILYIKLNIKKQKENDEFNNNSLFYILSILFFMLLTYLFYYFIFHADNNIKFSIINITVSSFMLSYFGAFLFSVVIFLALIFRNKISKIQSCVRKITKTSTMIYLRIKQKIAFMRLKKLNLR